MPEKRTQVQLINAILCDDHRREDNGKVILIGIYTGDIVVSNIPANILLRVWLNFRTEGTGGEDISVRIVDGESGLLTGIDGRIDNVSGEEDYISLVTPKLPLSFDEEGTIVVQWKSGESDWIDLISKRIICKPPVVPEDGLNNDSGRSDTDPTAEAQAT